MVKASKNQANGAKAGMGFPMKSHREPDPKKFSTKKFPHNPKPPKRN
jgi:hypothetical protein